MSKIYVIGIGPGAYDQMTGKAIRAMNESDAIIGYTVYVDLVKEYFPGKEFMTTPMKKEVDRCVLAFEEAKKGKTVSMICSGDAGVYGMAGLMYEIGEESGELEFCHNPFSMPQGGLEALNEKDPLEILAYQYDIVCNGVELSSGAVRNHDMQIMEKAFEIAGYDKSVLEEKFGALYNAFQFGAPPHAGMAPGVDRMIMLLRNEENIREIIPFPMSGTAQDLMCGAPNEVTEQQLREVHIKVRD